MKGDVWKVSAILGAAIVVSGLLLFFFYFGNTDINDKVEDDMNENLNQTNNTIVPICGNGDLETGEVCDGDSDCNENEECSADCMECLEKMTGNDDDTGDDDDDDNTQELTDFRGFWITQDEIDQLSEAGDTWDRILEIADGSLGQADIANQNYDHPIDTLAAALVYAKTGDTDYRDKAIEELVEVIGTEENDDDDCEYSRADSDGGPAGARSLAIGRNLAAYMIAADVLNFRENGYNPSGQGEDFEMWVQEIRFRDNCPNTGSGSYPDGDWFSISETHDAAGSNGNAMAGGARVAAAAYLNDKEELDLAFLTFRRYLGDTSVGPDLRINDDDPTWIFDQNNPQAINPKDAEIDSYPVDGVIVNDQRRGGERPTDPDDEPGYTQYPWEGMEGAYIQAVIFERLGYKVDGKGPFDLEDEALLRTAEYQKYLQDTFGGDWYDSERSSWVKHLVNCIYEKSYPAHSDSDGRAMAWSMWTFPDSSDFCDGTFELVQENLNNGTPPPAAASSGIWISQEEINQLPTSGEAWDTMMELASQSTSDPDLSDQNDETNVRVMAKALVFARTGNTEYRDDVVEALEVITYEDTQDGGRTLALGRELGAYVVAADIISLDEVDSSLDSDFRDFIDDVRYEDLDGKTLIFTHEDRPNNWGTHAGFSRAAVAVYLEDQDEIERTADVFKGWLGDRDTYDGFDYGDLCWQSDQDNPVGINPLGATLEIDGEDRDVSGVLPDDQRRGNSGPDHGGGCPSYVGWPPEEQNYAYEGLQGAIAQALVLYRAGYDVWNWEDQAIKRAFDWLHETNFDDGDPYPAEGDDRWQTWLANYYYCEDYPADDEADNGKNVGFTSWTHANNQDC